MSTNEFRKDLLSRFIHEVWTEGQIDASEAYIAEAYTVRHDPGDPWEGRELSVEGFKERARQSRAPFPDQRFEVENMFADGDTVIALWRWSATHLGDYPGFPASGKRLTTSGATAYDFDDRNRIRGHWQIADRLGVYRQLRAQTP